MAQLRLRSKHNTDAGKYVPMAPNKTNIFDTMSNISYIANSSIETRMEWRMPVQLKSTYVFIFTAIVIFAVYGWWIFGVIGIEYFTGPDALIRIGKAISILIIGGYAFEISVLLTMGIFSVKVLKSANNDFTLDERDMQILYKSMYNSHLALCTGLFLSIGALALGLEAFWVFNFIVLAFLVSVIAELSTKLFLYKRGS